MNKYLITYDDGYSCNSGIFKVVAKNEIDAERLFYLYFENRNSKYELSKIEEYDEELFYTEEDILKEKLRYQVTKKYLDIALGSPIDDCDII